MKPDSPQSRDSGAFTRLDLLVILAVLVLLAGVLHPAWANSRPSQSLICMDNLRRLQTAWLLYAEDVQGKLPGNYHGGFVPTTGGERPWACGWLDWTTSPDNSNTVYLTNSRYACLGPFLDGEASFHKCPEDNYLSPGQLKRGWLARIRSYSMNGYVGEGNQSSGPIDPSYPIVKRLSDFRYLPPQQTFVFTEEHPDSINDPMLLVSMIEWRWTDLPGSFHDGGGWFTFADGHLERRAWRSPTTLPPVHMMPYNMVPIPPGDPDLAWVRARTTAR
jgi:hypothetical protein